MYALLKVFWDIALFRRGPQDTPAQWSLLVLLWVVNLMFAFFMLQLPDSKGYAPEHGLIIRFLLLHTIVVFSLVYIILWASNHKARFVQTMIAMLGVDLIIGIVELPLRLLASYLTEQISLAMLVFIGYMFLIGWMLAIYTHIMRNALSCSVFRGGAFAILIFFIGLFVQYQVMRVPG